MYFSIRHMTRFLYSSAISQSVMEVRMKPITDGIQHCLNFKLMTSPRARVLSYQDYLGNAVHHFDIPASHSQLSVVAESLVHMGEPAPLPGAMADGDWDELDAMTRRIDCEDYMAPSQFARPAPGLAELTRELGVARQRDPLTLLRGVTAGIARLFEYSPRTTR